MINQKSLECFWSGWRARIRTWAKGSKVPCATTTQLASLTRRIITFKRNPGNVSRVFIVCLTHSL